MSSTRAALARYIYKYIFFYIIMYYLDTSRYISSTTIILKTEKEDFL